MTLLYRRTPGHLRWSGSSVVALARWSTAAIGPDIHIKVGRTLYSVPWKLIGRRVDIRSTATMVQVFLDGELVKTRAALEQGKRADKTDYPPEKIAFDRRTPIWCRTGSSLRHHASSSLSKFEE